MATAKTINMGVAVALGVAIGAGLGVPMHNMGVGVAIGAALGAALGVISRNNSARSEGHNKPKQIIPPAGGEQRNE